MIQKILLKIIKFYQIFISPLLGANCRFYPSCSVYMEQSIKKYGILKGLKNGFLRILKCQPFYKGGVDMPH